MKWKWLNRTVPNPESEGMRNGNCRRRKARSRSCGELTRRRNRGGCRRGESEEAWWVWKMKMNERKGFK